MCKNSLITGSGWGPGLFGIHEVTRTNPTITGIYPSLTLRPSPMFPYIRPDRLLGSILFGEQREGLRTCKQRGLPFWEKPLCKTEESSSEQAAAFFPEASYGLHCSKESHPLIGTVGGGGGGGVRKAQLEIPKNPRRQGLGELPAGSIRVVSFEVLHRQWILSYRRWLPAIRFLSLLGFSVEWWLPFRPLKVKLLAGISGQPSCVERVPLPPTWNLTDPGRPFSWDPLVGSMLVDWRELHIELLPQLEIRDFPIVRRNWQGSHEDSSPVVAGFSALFGR